MISHTPRTLYDKWNKDYENKKERINTLKKRRETADSDTLSYIESELNELLVAVTLMHEVLADIGIMVYHDEAKN